VQTEVVTPASAAPAQLRVPAALKYPEVPPSVALTYCAFAFSQALCVLPYPRG
jgi:hypothetical protein